MFYKPVTVLRGDIVYYSPFSLFSSFSFLRSFPFFFFFSFFCYSFFLLFIFFYLRLAGGRCRPRVTLYELRTTAGHKDRHKRPTPCLPQVARLYLIHCLSLPEPKRETAGSNGLSSAEMHKSAESMSVSLYVAVPSAIPSSSTATIEALRRVIAVVPNS